MTDYIFVTSRSRRDTHRGDVRPCPVPTKPDRNSPPFASFELLSIRQATCLQPRRSLRPIRVVMTALTAFAVLVPLAYGDDAVVHDCSSSPTGWLRGDYSRTELVDALKHLSADIAEYTSCADAIRARLATLRPAGDNGDGNATLPDGPDATSSPTHGLPGAGARVASPKAESTGTAGSPGSLPASVPASAPPSSVAAQPGRANAIRVAGHPVRPGAVVNRPVPAALLIPFGTLIVGGLAAAGVTLHNKRARNRNRRNS